MHPLQDSMTRCDSQLARARRNDRLCKHTRAPAGWREFWEHYKGAVVEAALRANAFLSSDMTFHVLVCECLPFSCNLIILAHCERSYRAQTKIHVKGGVGLCKAASAVSSADALSHRSTSLSVLINTSQWQYIASSPSLLLPQHAEA